MQPSATLDDSYQYQPLKADRPAFRLLRLRRGYWTPIECDILHDFLDQPTQPYEALSYTWGNPNRNQRISVNGSTLAITWSLLWALIHLRYKDEDRILWIDGICIDQNSLAERGHQVQQMGDIYRSAERVIFWLGRATDQTAILMHSIHVFEEESNSYDCTDWTLNDPRWMAIWGKAQSKLQLQLQLSLEVRNQRLLWMQEQGLKTLLSRPWFKRVWIVQEVANARSGLICCGTNAVSAHLFALMPRVLDVPTDQLSQTVLDMMPGPSRLETWWADKRDMYSLLRYLGPRQSSEPRDIVYALRGVSTDANTPGTLEPNYEASVEAVVRQVSQHLYFCDVSAEKTFFKSIEELVANVPRLNSAAIGRLIKTSRKKELDIILERGGIVVSAETVRTASEGGEDWKDLLCYVVERGASVLPEALPEAAYRGDSVSLEILLAHCMVVKVQTLLDCAALNERNGPAVIATLARRKYEKYMLRPTPTTATWIASVVNPVSGPQVRQQLFKMWVETRRNDFSGILFAFQLLVSMDPFQYGQIMYGHQLGKVSTSLGHPPALSRSQHIEEGFFRRGISRYRRGFDLFLPVSIPAAVMMVGARVISDTHTATHPLIQICVDFVGLLAFEFAVILIRFAVTIWRRSGRLRCLLGLAGDRRDALKWGAHEVRCYLKHKIASTYSAHPLLHYLAVERDPWWVIFDMVIGNVVENLSLVLVGVLLSRRVAALYCAAYCIY